MTKAIAIIGAMFGDEGKGLITDFIAHKYKDNNPIVIRHNGGVNAGHSVTTPENQRHIFSHFGSGSFVGVPTYLSSHFVCNPFLYLKELKILKQLKVHPTLFVHPESLVTTPYDTIINMVLESRRGSDRHSSCGVGLDETVTRSLSHEKLTVLDLGADDLRNKLIHIRTKYVTERFKDHPLNGNSKSEKSWINILNDDDILDDWIDAAKAFYNNISLMDDIGLTNDILIFEGAQGLMLDQQAPNFPYVTRSNTGITNVMHILDNVTQQIESLDVIYVSRAYTTRHGDGPLEFEQDLLYNINDPTNTPNNTQGKLRFAPLLLDTLSSVTLHDFEQCDQKYNPKVKMAFTCLDQVSERGLFIQQGKQQSWDKEAFLTLLTESATYVSYGPTRNDVRKTQ